MGLSSTGGVGAYTAGTISFWFECDGLVDMSKYEWVVLVQSVLLSLDFSHVPDNVNTFMKLV